MIVRQIRQILQGQKVTEGAGVHLHRVFGFTHPEQFDPFLLLDDLRSPNREDFIMGFPWHPHRGIETITYVLQGDVEHGDSLGNKGIISSGEVQWMTAGSGIIHQEMPKGDEKGELQGFQLWANLPAASKMMPPRYRGITSSDIPQVKREDGTIIKIIAGEVDGVKGPADDIIIDPEYLDCTVPQQTEFSYPTKRGYTIFIYCIEGKGSVNDTKVTDGHLALFDDGDEITLKSGDESLRFLLCSGKPINEPIAWRGPIVMNSEDELELAFSELQSQTFIKGND
jgi:redox-sensitive bicupin YhaK (pirin superfamily)